MASRSSIPSFTALRSRVANLAPRDEAGYDAARKHAIWNKRLDTARAPDAVVRCTSAEQVVSTIRFARAQGLKVSPRGSGHHYEAAALRDGGLLLDLGGLDFIEIDKGARIARVGPGVRGGALSERLAAQGLAFPVGHCVDVGLGGYILAGGFGWNSGEWGAACGNLAAIEMVTATGEAILASAESQADLFWAARGGGAGFFAAVTAYHLRLHPLPEVYAWRRIFAAESAPGLADWLSDATAAAHPATEVGCFLVSHPKNGKPAIILRVTSCAASAAEARERIAPFFSPPDDAEPLGAVEGEAIPFTELPKMSPMPSGKRAAADHLWTDAPLGDLLLAIHAMPAPSPHATVDLVAPGGNSRMALPADAALSVGGGAGAGIYALWDDPAEDQANIAWVRRIDDALAPFRCGRYVGEADLAVDAGRLAECFTPQALERLRALRARHDPKGLFFAYP